MREELDPVLRRLESLERANRRLRLWGGAALLAGLSAGALGLAAAQEVPKVLRTELLEVVDGKGVVRVALGSTEGASGATIAVFNEKGETRFALATGAPLGSVLTMYGRGDGSGSPGVMLQARPGKQMPVMALTSPESSARAEISFEAADVPRIALHDKDDKAVFQAVGRAAPLVSVASGEGSARVELGFEGPAKGQITVRDKGDKVVFKAVK